MKTLIIMVIVLLVLAGCWVSMTGAGYSWKQATGFDFVLVLILLGILVIMKVGQAARELAGKGDEYDA